MPITLEKRISPVDQRERAAGCNAGGFAEFVALVVGVQRDALVAFLAQCGPDGFGREFVLVVQVGCGDTGHDDDGGDHAAKRTLRAVLRVVTLEDGETIHNAFFDRSFRRGSP